MVCARRATIHASWRHVHTSLASGHSVCPDSPGRGDDTPVRAKCAQLDVHSCRSRRYRLAMTCRATRTGSGCNLYQSRVLRLSSIRESVHRGYCPGRVCEARRKQTSPIPAGPSLVGRGYRIDWNCTGSPRRDRPICRDSFPLHDNPGAGTAAPEEETGTTFERFMAGHGVQETDMDLRVGDTAVPNSGRRPRSANAKVPVSVRLDHEVAVRIKTTDPGRQTPMNEVLRREALTGRKGPKRDRRSCTVRRETVAGTRTEPCPETGFNTPRTAFRDRVPAR